MIRHFLAHLVVACCVLAIATSAPAQGKKGGGGSPPPPPPPVHYTVVWLGMLEGYDHSEALAANSHGEIVGYSMAGGNLSTRVATRFTPTGPVNLNEEFADLLAARSDGPWRAWIAWGINELGQITGNITQGLGSHPFIYTPGDAALPRELTILPQMSGGVTWSRGINNFGEICGYYEADGGGTFVAAPGGPLIDMGPLGINGSNGTKINDAGQIAFSSGRYTPNLVLGDAGAFDSFPGWLGAINAQGDVAGGYSATTSGGKTKTTTTIYRAASPAALQIIYQGPSADTPLINDQRDVCFNADRRISLFRDGIGLIRIDTTIAPADAKWSTAYGTFANVLLNPDPTGDTSFPAIAGMASFIDRSGSSKEAFLLIPSAVP